MGFMGGLTAALYLALAVYLGGWFFNQWIGDFALLLFLLTVVTLGFWLAEHMHFKRARASAAATRRAPSSSACSPAATATACWPSTSTRRAASNGAISCKPTAWWG